DNYRSEIVRGSIGWVPARSSANGRLTRRAVAGPELCLVARLGLGARRGRLECHLEFVTGDPEGIAISQRMFRIRLLRALLGQWLLFRAAYARAVHLGAVAAAQVLNANGRGVDLDSAMKPGDDRQGIVQDTRALPRPAQGVSALIVQDELLDLLSAIHGPQKNVFKHGCYSLHESRRGESRPARRLHPADSG